MDNTEHVFEFKGRALKSLDDIVRIGNLSSRRDALAASLAIIHAMLTELPPGEVMTVTGTSVLQWLHIVTKVKDDIGDSGRNK